MDFDTRDQISNEDTTPDSSADVGKRKISRRRMLAMTGFTAGSLALFGGGIVSTSFSAEEGSKTEFSDQQFSSATGSIMLASFFNSESDQSNTLYASTNGTFFEKIGVAYQDANPGDPKKNWAFWRNERWQVYPQRDPSIIYRRGWFFMLAGYTDHDKSPGQIVPTIGYSQDLVTWSYPNSGKANGQNVEVTELPDIKKTPLSPSRFDMVAPDWIMDDDGIAWIVVSIGYFGQFHGDPQNDTMFPYLIRVTDLAPRAEIDLEDHPDSRLLVNYGPAKPIRLPRPSTNRIDGSLYKEDGIYYLSIKEGGVTNEIWSTTDLNLCDSEDSWSLVNEDVVTGFEGPCLAKFNKTYYLYTDKLYDYPPGASDGKNGIHYMYSDKLEEGWGENRRIIAADTSGKKCACRHGTVITLTGQAAQKVWDCRKKAGWPNFDYSVNFDDVRLEMARARGRAETVWYVEEGWLSFVVKNNIMTGYPGSHNFGPYDYVTRAQVAVVLYRLDNGQVAGKRSSEDEPAPEDTKVDSLVTEAFEWAHKYMIMTSAGDEAQADSDKSVTREELSVMLARYAMLRGLSFKDPNKSVFESMKDYATTSSWAIEELAWCCENGLLSGFKGSMLKPHDYVWRASLAKTVTILSSLIGQQQ